MPRGEYRLINNVVLVGRLTRDIDLRYTQGGTAVGNFSLAVDRNYTNANGERDTDFINCVVWRKAAETMANYTRKGSLIGIEGSIQTRNYENNQGQRVYVTEVLVNNFTFLEPKSVTQSRPSSSESSSASGNFANNDYNNNSFNQNTNQSDPFADSSNAFSTSAFDNDPFDSGNQTDTDIADDDLPF